VSKDVKFKDLGLMIIDEEQKFGVSTKEKLKQMRANVDTLDAYRYAYPAYAAFFIDGRP
jgi:transcription-repair coupling factor (superfamily II helicase)